MILEFHHNVLPTEVTKLASGGIIRFTESTGQHCVCKFIGPVSWLGPSEQKGEARD